MEHSCSFMFIIYLPWRSFASSKYFFLKDPQGCINQGLKTPFYMMKRLYNFTDIFYNLLYHGFEVMVVKNSSTVQIFEQLSR